MRVFIKSSVFFICFIVLFLNLYGCRSSHVKSGVGLFEEAYAVYSPIMKKGGWRPSQPTPGKYKKKKKGEKCFVIMSSSRYLSQQLDVLLVNYHNAPTEYREVIQEWSEIHRDIADTYQFVLDSGEDLQVYDFAKHNLGAKLSRSVEIEEYVSKGRIPPS